MATSIINNPQGSLPVKLQQVRGGPTSPMRNYAMGSTITVPELPIRPYARQVLVIGDFANKNGMMLMPTVVPIAANSQQLTVYNMWNTQTDSMQSTGNFDIKIVDIDYVT
jgi:hypothetical protein